MQSLTTYGITVFVQTFYQSEYSNPFQSEYMFAYKIIIQNNNNFAVKLLRRNWQIFQADGIVRNVQGEGVIGLQPTIIPTAKHQYLSGCNLKTDIGKMQGIYQMQNLNSNQLFNVQIPPFILIAPSKLN